MENTRRVQNTLHRKRGVGSAQFNRPTERMRAENTGRAVWAQTHRRQGRALELFVPAVLPQTKCPAVTRWPTTLLGSRVLSIFFFTHPLLCRAAVLAHDPLPLHHSRRSPNHKGSLLDFRVSLLQRSRTARPTLVWLLQNSVSKGRVAFLFYGTPQPNCWPMKRHFPIFTAHADSMQHASKAHLLTGYISHKPTVLSTPNTSINTQNIFRLQSKWTCSALLYWWAATMHKHFSAHNQAREC